MIKRVGKKGDTLVEVMLAIGIFSMVAIAVVAVMSSGTSSAQTALETTLTREEIDSQADALRFIQASYASDKSSENFQALWQAIKDQAIPITNEGELNGGSFNFEYAPESCDALYRESGEAREHGFIVNMREISNQLNNGWNDGTLDDNNNMIIKGGDKDGSDEYLLAPTTTYPRLVFDDSNLLAQGGFGDAALSRAEGLYVVAVPDLSNTEIIEAEENQVAYYDFYIRSCWYGTGSRSPSTISTVMRLYNPDAIAFKPAIIASDVEKSCDTDVAYVMVDANIQTPAQDNIQQSGVPGISVETYTIPNLDQTENRTLIEPDERDEYCFYYDGLFKDSAKDPFPYAPYPQRCPDNSTRLKVKQGYNGTLGGDFWYPLQVGTNVAMVVSSDGAPGHNYKLYYDYNNENMSEKQDELDNPYICAQQYVTCLFSNSSTGQNDYLIDENNRRLDPETINTGEYRQLEVFFEVGCAGLNQKISGVKDSNGIPLEDIKSMAVNTSWKQ